MPHFLFLGDTGLTWNGPTLDFTDLNCTILNISDYPLGAKLLLTYSYAARDALV